MVCYMAHFDVNRPYPNAVCMFPKVGETPNTVQQIRLMQILIPDENAFQSFPVFTQSVPVSVKSDGLLMTE